MSGGGTEMAEYAELVKKLHNRRVCLQTGLNLDNDYPLLREAADAIEQLQTECQDWYKAYMDLLPTRWYSVEECLPELHEEVLVCNAEYGLSGLGFATVAVWDGTDWIETWDRSAAIHCVTHWMPLPTPPKEEHSPVYESLKRGLEQAINGETREEET